MVKISRKFFEAVKLANRPAYKIAWEAGLHPVILSKILHGYDKVWPDDRRVVAVARVLHVDPAECFEEAGEKQNSISKKSGEQNKGRKLSPQEDAGSLLRE